MRLQEAYDTLGLPRSADATQVKTAYRRLVSETHPDRGGQTADFIKVRAAYEIVSAFLHEPTFDDDTPIPDDLRAIIDAVVRDFRAGQEWAEAETARQMELLESRMITYIRTASRAELRQFSVTFRNSWDAVVNASFQKCNQRCDAIIQDYESWYTTNTQAVFDEMYRKELLHFAWRRRFWEVFLLLGALAVGLGVVIGWEGPVRPWVSIGLVVLAFVASFLVFRWWARRERRMREKVEPLSVVPFEIQPTARFQTESKLRRGRLTTGALGAAGMFLGNAASSGFAIPVVGAVAGAALGGAFDRLFNPTERMRESMQRDLRRFMQVATPEVTGYVIEAHERLLAQVREQIMDNYRERVQGTVRLLTTGTSVGEQAGRGVTAVSPEG